MDATESTVLATKARLELGLQFNIKNGRFPNPTEFAAMLDLSKEENIEHLRTVIRENIPERLWKTHLQTGGSGREQLVIDFTTDLLSKDYYQNYYQEMVNSVHQYSPVWYGSVEGICRVLSEYRDGNIQIIEGDIKNLKTVKKVGLFLSESPLSTFFISNVEMAIDSAKLSVLIQDAITLHEKALVIRSCSANQLVEVPNAVSILRDKLELTPWHYNIQLIQDWIDTGFDQEEIQESDMIARGISVFSDEAFPSDFIERIGLDSDIEN